MTDANLDAAPGEELPDDAPPVTAEGRREEDEAAEAEAPFASPELAADDLPEDTSTDAEEEADESIARDLPQPEPASLVPILEAVLFAAPSPLATPALKKVFGDEVLWEVIKTALGILEDQTRAEGRGILLCEVAGGWQFLSREEYFPYVQRIARTKSEERLSPAAIETLAIVAYKQPVTRAEVDAVRGVSSGSLIRTLMDRKLVRVAGRAEVPGSPFQYGTTKRFLEHFGLRSPRDLPDPKELGRLLSERDTDGAS